MLTRKDLIQAIMSPTSDSFEGNKELEQRFYNRLDRMTNQHLAELLEKYTGNRVTPIMSNLFM